MSKANWPLGLLAALTISWTNSGCNSHSNAASNNEHSHVRILTMLHTRATTTLGRPPRDEQEFKQTLAGLQLPLDSLNVDSIDQLFVSERDGQPLAIHYGALPANLDVVVYEQTGAEGKRLVGHRIGMVEELDEAAWNALIGANK